MIKESITSFPVPTPANPSAVYDQADLRKVRDELVPSEGAVEPGDRLAEVKAKLAQGRNLNHAAVVEEHERMTDKETAKRAFKSQDQLKDKQERQVELETLGVPVDYAYLMDTCTFARRQYGEDRAEEADEDVKAYERSLKRVLESKKSGADRLMEHLESRQEINAKKAMRASMGKGGDSLHISRTNAEFNKQVGKSLKGDRHSQALKQSLERGTAV